MSEVKNTTYLDLVGLQKYDELIKLFIKSGNDRLAGQIANLNSIIGDFEFDGSEAKDLAETINEIYTSIADIVTNQDAKNEELTAEIKKVADDLKFVTGGDSENEATIGDINAALDKLKGRVDAIAANIDTLVGEGEGSVKKTAADAQAAAEKHADDLNTAMDTRVEALEAIDHDHANKEVLDGISAEKVDAWDAAEQTAKDYADSLATNYDAAGSAAAAQSAAEADATSKANAAESAAKTYADGLVKDEEGNVKFDAVGSAATAEQNAKDHADDLVKDAEGNVKFDAVGSAAAAQAAAEADATSKADAALEEAKEYAKDLVQNEEGKSLFDAVGSAAQALADAKAYVNDFAHATDVRYEDGFIKLYDENGAIGKGFDASPFIVHGLIDTVEFVTDDKGNATTTLRFTFNLDSGDSENNKKIIDVDFAKYVDVYKGDNTSIVLDSASKTFSVNEVAANKTKTVDTIPVAGGPLAKLFENAGIDVSDIAAGSSVEDVLFSLLCKELWAQTLTFSEGTVASSIAQPSFTLENSGKTVEVGTKCALSEITMSAATPSISKNRTYSGFTYGYSAANDNAQDSANTSITAGVDKAAELNDGDYTMKREYTQFNGATNDTATANADASQVKLDGAELTVSYVGSNSVKVTVGGPTASATFAAMPVYYACSNLKKTKDAVKDSEGQYKSDAKDAKKVTSGAASNSKTLTVTGARAYWMGAMKTPLAEFTSASIREAGENTEKSGLVKSLKSSPDTTLEVPAGSYDVVIITQNQVTSVISKAQGNFEIGGNFTKNHAEVNIEGANGFTAAKYHVYHCNADWDKDTLTITYK